MRQKLAYFAIGVLAVAGIGWTMNASDIHLRGRVYTGTSKIALTNAAGNLVTTSGTYTGNVGVSGTLGVTGAVTMASTLGVTGAVTFNAPSVHDYESISAAGTLKTDCTQTTAENVRASGTSLQGICLLPAAAGIKQIITNASGVALYVYPQDASEDAIQTISPQFLTYATDAPFVLPATGKAECLAVSTSVWSCQIFVGNSHSTVAAAGTNQATGTALGIGTMNANVRVTGANGTTAITLPTGSDVGCIRIHTVVTSAANTLAVFGHNSDNDTINGAAADAVYTQMAGTSLLYCTTDGVAWLTY